MAPTVRPLRSALFLPASNPRAIAKARTLDADAVILDLEDSVAPEEKARARDAAVNAVNEGGFRSPTVAIRVNALTSAWGEDDLAAVAGSRADAVLVPKVATPADIGEADARLVGSSTRLWTMIETCRAIANLQPIADMAASTRLSTLIMGSNDLAAELRARPAPDRAGLVAYFALVVAAARAAGIAVLDGVRNDLTDVEALERECAQGRALGFDGKSLIHPAQIDAANRTFAPDAEELVTAQRVILAFADRANAGKGAIRLDGRMVEQLHLVDAERLVALEAAIRASR